MARPAVLTAVLMSVASLAVADDPAPETAVRRTGSVTAFFAGWSPMERRIYDALVDETTVNFADTPLIDAIEYLSRQHEIPMMLDVAELEAAGILTDEPINMILAGIPLRSTLRLMFRNLDLGVVVDDDVLIVTTAKEVEAHSSTRTYPVRDLIADGESDTWKELATAVESVCDERDGKVVTVPSLGCLVVTQNQRNHEAIVKLLDALRGAQISDGLKTEREPNGYLPFDHTHAVITGDERARYLTVRPVLLVQPESRRDIGTVLSRHRYEVKDRLQSVLSVMTYDEARTPEGFDAAKKKIENEINSFLVEQDAPRITGVVLDYWNVR